MVLLKLNCPPEDTQATISVRISTASPTLSLKSLASSQEPLLAIQTHLRCEESKQPSRPITFSTSGTIFDATKPESGNMDNLALGMLGAGLVCNNAESGNRKVISLGYFKVHRARQDGDDAANLRERPDYSFLTVPAQDSGKEVTVTYTLTSERLFAYADNMTPGDLVVGEKYSIGLREGYVGTAWWSWGALDDDLTGKKLHAFSKGDCLTWSADGPNDAEIVKEGWVVGEDVSQLKFVVAEGGASCAVVVVE